MSILKLREHFGRWTGASVLALAILSGCGGGGGSAPAPANTKPVVGMTLAGKFDAGGGDADVSAGIGSALVLSASGSTDADGDVLSYKWTIVNKPATSKLSISATETAAQQTVKPDMSGLYTFSVRVTDSKGAFSEKQTKVQIRDNAAPVSNIVVVINSISPVDGESGKSVITATSGYMVALNGAGSSDPDGDVLSYAWTVTSKPGGSAALLSSATGSSSQISPDLLGDYVITMKVTDSLGASSNYETTISVTNRGPLAAISSNVTPVALPTGPAIHMPLNTLITLRGTGSIDADGDTLTYAWSMSSKPAGSAATLSSTSGAAVHVTPELAGSYVVLLRVTDSQGAYSERSLIIEAGNYAPVAVTDKNRVTVLSGAAVTASAGLSYDEDGDALTYQWSIDARPLGSTAPVAAPASSILSFTPDMAGTYVAAVTVSDGKSSNVAYVSIKALSSIATSVPLNFVPLQSRYSKGLDKLVVVASNPNTLKIIDPFTTAIKTVLLPVGVKGMNLSPDGKLAAVLHEGIVSLVDIDAATLIRSSATSGAQTDAFVTNAGMIYMIGQTGGQWVDQAVGVVNGHTGVNVSATLGLGSWTAYGTPFYGTQYGIYAPLKNKVFLMEQGLSPADIKYFSIGAATGAVNGTGDSPYHGDYNMGVPLFLSGNEDLLFTSSGTYFHTDTLKYAGKFNMTGWLLSMSHASDADEALVLQPGSQDIWTYQYTYSASYLRFTGALFLPEAAISLPVIANEQSYGIGIFHSANGNHVALVQTVTAVQNGTGAKYYVTTR